MEKFLYTNSNGTQSLFEAVPLTSDLYSALILKDKEFLQKIIDNEIEEFRQDASFKDQAEQMLKKHGLGKDGVYVQKNQTDGKIMYVLNKTVLSENSAKSEEEQTIRQKLRNSLPSSKIRLFKKEKMQYDI